MAARGTRKVGIAGLVLVLGLAWAYPAWGAAETPKTYQAAPYIQALDGCLKGRHQAKDRSDLRLASKCAFQALGIAFKGHLEEKEIATAFVVAGYSDDAIRDWLKRKGFTDDAIAAVLRQVAQDRAKNRTCHGEVCWQ